MASKGSMKGRRNKAKDRTGRMNRGKELGKQPVTKPQQRFVSCGRKVKPKHSVGNFNYHRMHCYPCGDQFKSFSQQVEHLEKHGDWVLCKFCGNKWCKKLQSKHKLWVQSHWTDEILVYNEEDEEVADNEVDNEVVADDDVSSEEELVADDDVSSEEEVADEEVAVADVEEVAVADEEVAAVADEEVAAVADEVAVADEEVAAVADEEGLGA